MWTSQPVERCDQLQCDHCTKHKQAITITTFFVKCHRKSAPKVHHYSETVGYKFNQIHPTQGSSPLYVWRGSGKRFQKRSQIMNFFVPWPQFDLLRSLNVKSNNTRRKPMCILSYSCAIVIPTKFEDNINRSFGEVENIHIKLC